MRKFLVLFLYAICYMLYASPAHAGESALSISPAIYESVVDRGGFVKTEVLLTNLTNFPLPIKGTATAFMPIEQIPSSLQSNYDSSSWFKLEPADFILQPSERKKITLTITAPRSSEPGGHYASVYFQPLLPEGVLSSPTALARVGILAFLVVPGDLHESLQLDKLAHPSWTTFGPVNLALQVDNLGNVHTSLAGEIKLTNLFHKQIGLLKIDPTTILPGTSKSISLTWDHRLGIGPYFIESNLEYSATHIKLVVPLTTIWYLPWPLILSGILLLTFVYKIFILNASRVKLAWRALTGHLQEKDVIHDQITSEQKTREKDSRDRPRSHHRRRTH